MNYLTKLIHLILLRKNVEDVEEDVEVQEDATGPSFSETHSQARIRLFIEDLSEEDKAYALKLLAV